MKKRVTMFVWNEFTNDARVMRECTALQEQDYHVLLIALHGDQPHIDISSPNFQIKRIRAELTIFCKIIIGFMIFISFFIHLLVTITLLMLIWMLTKTKWCFLVKKISLISQMTWLGLFTKTDIYHANDLNTLPQAVFCAKLKRKKLIFDSHEVNTSRSGYDSRIYRVMEAVLIRFPDCVIHENYTRAKYFRRVYGFKSQVIYNYPVFRDATKKSLHKELGIPTTEPILLYQGGLQAGRGLDKLLAAIPQFKRGTVVFIGDGKLKPFLLKEAKRLGVEKRAIFIPKVPLEQLPSYTRNAYLGFQLLNHTCFNHYSAASNKLFEYLMAGVPVIACSFPEIKRVVLREDVGIIVDSHDPQAIAAGVNRLLERSYLRNQLSENALQARVKYAWDVEKEKFLRIYQNLLKDEGSE